ncbi:FAD-dependent oxidoreductase [Streptomyces albofaciens JCM 4342]|uniref:FAD-dependent oxidoreductase n=1 Tax=Streptomyces albofaciens TaxID=66866 RepID=UPI00123B5CDF|nr:FAD-dependent oxidoreductase [Streptomyces albofaciens]KAA6221475.1 FAD-dependent oxidoreductase [Streptomyces albofaciens JCM 4342]
MFRVTVDGAGEWARPGQTVASVLLAAGRLSWRTTRGGRPRGVFCGIGVCHDCLVVVNGVPDVRACRRVVAAGDRIETQVGARLPELAPDALWAGARDVTVPVVVVGAGPAGMAAALAAAGSGVRVVLVDDGERPGGQYHRQTADGPARGAAVRAVQEHPRIEWLAGATVWGVEAEGEGGGPPSGTAAGRDAGWTVHVLQGPADAPARTPYTLHADALVLCTGAYDRALPFPGWDLPGVVTAGAAQALAKGQRTAIGRRVVVSGTGPFLLPVTSSLLTVGARVLGVYEAGTPAAWLRAPVAALRDGGGKVPELLAYAATMARHRVPYRPRRAVVAAHGRDRVEAVTVARLAPDWSIVPGTGRRIEDVDALCVGYGFTPQLELALAAGCALRDGARVAVGPAQQTSVPGVYAAGEPTGIGGAALAAAEGELAGLAAARWAGARSVAARRAPAVRRRVLAGRRFARLLAATHPVRPGWRTWLDEDTLVCRCEEVPYGQLRTGLLTADGMRTFKLGTRVGLGPCQGRVCARNAAGLCGPDALPDPQTADRRPIAQPVRLADLAAAGAEAGDTGVAHADAAEPDPVPEPPSDPTSARP